MDKPSNRDLCRHWLGAINRSAQRRGTIGAGIGLVVVGTGLLVLVVFMRRAPVGHPGVAPN